MMIDRDLLRCPTCSQDGLLSTRDALVCRACTTRYGVVDGIPILLPARLDEAKAAQASYFDRLEFDEFEITRPWSAPALHQWLLAEKFRRSISSLRPAIQGGAVLCVCAGSGMDAEFLSRAGATSVIALDVSVGAARRAAERAKRAGLNISPIVGDAEALPFRNDVFDVAYVHDGLHHLADPSRAIAEMSRVSRRGVSINEPVDALVTRIAMLVGVAEAHEEAGNRVARLDPRRVAAELFALGWEIRRCERYLMYYRHRPGRTARLLSSGPVLPVMRALAIAFAAVGRVGNKSTIQATRNPEPSRRALPSSGV